MVEILARVATTGIVQQGSLRVKITKESLESFPKRVEIGPAIPFTVGHDPYCLPIGKIDEAWIEPFGDEYAVIAKIRVEDTHSTLRHKPSGVDLVRLEFESNPKPFIPRRYGENEEAQEILSVDMTNFATLEEFEAFQSDVAGIDEGISCDNSIHRYELGPDPFLQFVLSNPDITAAMALGVWVIGRIERFVRYTVDETLRKLADDISDAFSLKMKQIVKAYVNRRKQDDRPSTTQIAIPGNPELILLVTTQASEDFPNIDLGKLSEEMEKYGDILQEAASVVFARVGINDWELQYLTTKSGKVIGTLNCHKRTLEKLQNMKQSNDKKIDD